jgi:hypothetical protein
VSWQVNKTSCLRCDTHTHNLLLEQLTHLKLVMSAEVDAFRTNSLVILVSFQEYLVNILHFEVSFRPDIYRVIDKIGMRLHYCKWLPIIACTSNHLHYVSVLYCICCCTAAVAYYCCCHDVHSCCCYYSYYCLSNC